MDRITNHPWAVLIGLAAMVVAVGHRAAWVRQDNSPDAFFAADPQARRIYREFVRTFGADEYLIVQLRGTRADRARDLHQTGRLARALHRVPGVVAVLSPSQIYQPDLRATPKSPVPREVAAVGRELRALPFYRHLGLARPEGLGVVALVVMRGPQARTRLAGALDTIAGDLRREGGHPLVAGLALANAAIDRESRRALRLFLPLVVLLCLVVGWILFRSLRALAALFLPAGGAVIVGMAVLGWTGEPLSLITGVMPPLVFAVGFAGAIHLLTQHGSLVASGGEPARAAAVTVREKWVPTGFAYVTTAVGFGSLALSPVPAVRTLGLSVAAALASDVLLVTFGTSALLVLLRPRPKAPEHRWLLLERLARVSVARRPWVLLTGALLAAGLAAGVPRLRPTIDGMELLARDAPERVAYQQLAQEGLGLGNYDLWIRRPVPDAAALITEARRLRALAEALRQIPGITAAVGAQDLLALLGYRTTGTPHIPDSLAALRLASPAARRTFQAQLHRFWHPGRGLKLTLLTTTPDASYAATQRRRIRQTVARYYPQTRVELSGQFALLIATPGTLMSTLIESLAVTVAVISLLFLLALRSLWLLVGGMVVNLLPVLAVLGVMGWLGLPLDVATVMTGSVVFGIAVDDTFHYLYHRRRSGSIQRAAHIAGQGIVATSLVVAGGFAALGASGFAPVMRFGLLTAFAVLVALAADALLLPALVGRRVEAGPAG